MEQEQRRALGPKVKQLISGWVRSAGGATTGTGAVSAHTLSSLLSSAHAVAPSIIPVAALGPTGQVCDEN